ncbi:MAG: hypothetical protein RML95_11650, partial [Anaerolineae bacterium]|nr:hypothetical protein [Anaerolineae bacterium]
MGTSTLILLVASAISIALIFYAVVIALQQRQPKSVDLSELWPPRYFLGDVRRELPKTAELRLMRQDAPPTAQFDRPTSPVAHTPAAERSAHASAADSTSQVPREIVQQPPENPLDRTSRFARPVPPP